MGEQAPRVQLHVRIESDLAEWLEAEAERRLVSKAFLLERALEEFREKVPAA